MGFHQSHGTPVSLHHFPCGCDSVFDILFMSTCNMKYDNDNNDDDDDSWCKTFAAATDYVHWVSKNAQTLQRYSSKL